MCKFPSVLILAPNFELKLAAACGFIGSDAGDGNELVTVVERGSVLDFYLATFQPVQTDEVEQKLIELGNLTWRESKCLRRTARGSAVPDGWLMLSPWESPSHALQ